jgi:hypothetical protein
MRLIRFDPGGSICCYPAVAPQLFLIVPGEEWVRGIASDQTRIKAGQAAYWEKESGHESGTEAGLTAMIIERVHIDPAEGMPPV